MMLRNSVVDGDKVFLPGVSIFCRGRYTIRPRHGCCSPDMYMFPVYPHSALHSVSNMPVYSSATCLRLYPPAMDGG